MKHIDPNKLNNYRWQKARKKPVIIECAQIEESFSVLSMEGRLNGKKGDWLMKGIDGELYICDQKIFKKTYDLLD